MKTRIKIIINDHVYEVESTYEHGISDTKSLIEEIVRQELRIIAAKSDQKQ